MRSKRLRKLIVLALFLLSWASSWMLTMVTRKAIAESWPFMEPFLAFTPILSFFATLISFFLLTRLLRTLCGIVLYYGGVELPARDFQFAIYLSTAIPSAAALVQWVLLATGVMSVTVGYMPGVPGAPISLGNIVKEATLPGLPLILLQAGMVVLLMWKKPPIAKRLRMAPCMAMGACAFWLLGLLARLGLSWLIAGA